MLARLPVCLFVFAFVCAALLLAPPVSAVQVTLQPVVSSEVAALLKRGPRQRAVPHIGLLVQDLTTQQVLEAWHPDELFVPASTMKLLSMGALITQRGPQGWYSADVTAPAAEVLAQAKRLSHITLHGAGDPSLGVTGAYSLQALAQQLAKKGVSEIGEVRLAGTLDEASWPAQPLLGTAVTSLRLAALPGWNEGAQAYTAQVGEALTRQLRAAGIAVGQPGGSFGRLLGRLVIEQQSAVTLGAPPTPTPSAPEQGLATVRSTATALLIAQTLKPSDNLWAEQLGAGLGSNGAWNKTTTHAAMLAAMRDFLKRAGVDAAPLSLHDASGLSSDNRLTPRALVTVLRRMYDLPITAKPHLTSPQDAYISRRNLFVEALPLGGTGEANRAQAERGGTLARRFNGSKLDVRAKTGTLPGVSSLAGYVQGKSGHILAFAVMMDGADEGYAGPLRAFQDELVALIAAKH